MTLNIGTGMLLIGAAGAGYWRLIRPWYGQWGATDEETSRPLPGDELLPEARHIVTRAITIEAPAAAVWPWLLQLGQQRGGFYSYQHLENLIGCEIHNVTHLDPALQISTVGERVRLGAQENHPEYVVKTIEPERALVLFGDDPFIKITWQFILQSAGAGRTRLLIRSRHSSAEGILPRLGYDVLMPPIHFFMEQKMMRTLKRLAESAPAEVPVRRTL